MTIYTLGSSSSGNCHILSDEEGNKLLLDAGVKSFHIKEGLNFDFSKIDGVLVTHAHKDHCLCSDELENTYGLDVFRPYLLPDCKDKRTFGKYAVTSFDVPHDGEPTCGFYIRHTNGFKMLYLTDLEYCKYTFRKQEINAIMVEANWDKRYVDVSAANASHKILGHMDIDTCIEFLKENKTDALQTVILCHMSSFTLDIRDAVNRVKQEVGIENVFAAKKGIFVEL